MLRYFWQKRFRNWFYVIICIYSCKKSTKEYTYRFCQIKGPPRENKEIFCDKGGLLFGKFGYAHFLYITVPVSFVVKYPKYTHLSLRKCSVGSTKWSNICIVLLVRFFMCDGIFPFISFQLCLCTLLQTLPKFWKFSYMSTFLKLLNFSCTCTFLKFCKFFYMCTNLIFRNSPIWCVHFKNLIFGKKI